MVSHHALEKPPHHGPQAILILPSLPFLIPLTLVLYLCFLKLAGFIPHLEATSSIWNFFLIIFT